MDRGTGGPQRGARQPGHRPQRHLTSRRDSFALKYGCVGPVKRGSGVKVVKHLVQAGAPDSVRQAVVHLRQQSHAAILEALDEPDLPEGATPFELVGQQIADQRTELTGAARGWDADAADLAAEIEVQVIHPSGAVEAKGNLNQSAQERAKQACPGLDQRARADSHRSRPGRSKGREQPVCPSACANSRFRRRRNWRPHH